MASIADRVKETTASTGTAAITLAGAASGFRSFTTAFGAGSTLVSYCIVGTTEWEIGEGTFDGSTGLTRTSVLSSSNANALVDFSAGSKDVFVSIPASRIPQLDAIQTFTAKQTFGAAAYETKVALAANNIDLASANYFTKTISALTTFTVSNVPSAGISASFILDLTTGGAFAITWWAGVKWAGGTAPTLTAAAGRDVLGFFTHDGGTTWTGLVLGKDVR
jgi:hypothetical protein